MRQRGGRCGKMFKYVVKFYICRLNILSYIYILKHISASRHFLYKQVYILNKIQENLFIHVFYKKKQ